MRLPRSKRERNGKLRIDCTSLQEKEVTMARILSLAAIAGLLVAASSALAASETSTSTPGHKMQKLHKDPHTRGATHGASKLSPGHRMQLAHNKPHTRSTSPGASSFTPSR
jgi:hypothetical protein